MNEKLDFLSNKEVLLSHIGHRSIISACSLYSLMHKVWNFNSPKFYGIFSSFVSKIDYFFEFLSKFWAQTNLLLTGTLGTTAFPTFDQTTSGFIVEPVTTVAFVTTAPSPGKVSSCDTRDWYHTSYDMWLVKEWELTTLLTGVAIFSMCYEPWPFRLLLFLCANGYAQSSLNYYFA